MFVYKKCDMFKTALYANTSFLWTSNVYFIVPTQNV